VAVVAHHARRNDFPVDLTDQEALGINLGLATDVLVRVVVWNDQTAGRPEIDHCVLVCGPVGADM
jgi:hypothetical protein